MDDLPLRLGWLAAVQHLLADPRDTAESEALSGACAIPLSPLSGWMVSWGSFHFSFQAK